MPNQHDAPKPNPRPRRTVPVALAVALAALFGLFLWATRGTPRDSPWHLGWRIASSLAIFAVLGLTMHVAVLVHELGHLAAGRLVGLHSTEMVVGPWGWRRRDGKTRFYWTGHWLSHDGWAAASYVGEHMPARRSAILILGGPVASLLLALVAFYAGAVPLWRSLAGVVCLVIGGMSLLALLGSAIPKRDGKDVSDALALWRLWRGYSAADRCTALANVRSALESGGRPREWPREWVDAATAIPDGTPEDACGCYYAYLWHLDRLRMTEMGAFLQRAVQGCDSLPLEMRALAHLDAAVCAAWVDDDPVAARNHLEQSAPAGEDPSPAYRYVELVVLLAEEPTRERAHSVLAAWAALRRPEDRLGILAHAAIQSLICRVIERTQNPPAGAAEVAG